MNRSGWPKTLDEAVKICLSTLTPEEKELLKYTPEDRLIWFHFEWALNMQKDFGMYEGNSDLLESCGVSGPDDAAMIIVEAVRRELSQQPEMGS
jgi:hypothetical protein